MRLALPLLALCACSAEKKPTDTAAPATEKPAADPLKASFEIKRHTHLVFTFSPDSKQLLLGSGKDCGLFLVPLDEPSKTLIVLPPCLGAVADSSTRVEHTGKHVLVWQHGAGSMTELRVFDAGALATPPRRFPLHAFGTIDLAAAPRTEQVVTVGYDANKKLELAVWSLEDGKRLATHATQIGQLPPHLSVNRSNTLVAFNRDSKVALHELPSLKPRGSVKGSWHEFRFAGDALGLHENRSWGKTDTFQALDPATLKPILTHTFAGGANYNLFSDGVAFHFMDTISGAQVELDGSTVRDIGRFSVRAPDRKHLITSELTRKSLRTAWNDPPLREFPTEIVSPETIDLRTFAGVYTGRGIHDGQVGISCDVTLTLTAAASGISATLATHTKESGEPDLLSTRTIKAFTVTGDIASINLRGEATVGEKSETLNADAWRSSPGVLSLSGWQETPCMPIRVTRSKQ